MPEKKEDILGDGRFILLVHPGKDEKVRYLAARKIFEIWKSESFSNILTLCREKKDILVRRSDDKLYVTRLAAEFDEIGSSAEVKEQKKIAGHDLF